MNTNRLLQHFNRISEAPDAIPRLRRFILDLAVRGKLVAQDPNDEPASELLKRIQAEKARLVKAGKSRAQKPGVPLANGELPFAVPCGWQWSQLAEVGLISPRNNADDKLSASFVPMTLIPAEYGMPHKHEVRQWGEIKSGFTHFAAGDVGLAKITPCFENGKSTIFRNLTGGIGAGTTELHIVRPILISADYILLFLKCPHFIKTGIPKMTGTAGQKRVSTEYFAYSPFPLPPNAEQHRIIAKVAELMALCDQLKSAQTEREQTRDRLVASCLHRLNQPADTSEYGASEAFRDDARFTLNHFPRLTTRPTHIKQLRQTILNLAVRGKLVPQDPNDEPASELLKKIQGKNAKKESSLPLVAPDDRPFKLPHGWSWARFGNVFTLEYGDNLPAEKRSNSGKYPVYGSNGVVGSHSECFVNLPCIVVGRKGSAGALNLSLTEGCCVTDVAYYCIPPSGLDIIFSFKLFHTLRLDLLGKGIKPGLSRNEVYILPIAIPPLVEQRRIVAKVDELMVLCDQLENQLTTNETDNCRLLESLLHNALTPISEKIA